MNRARTLFFNAVTLLFLAATIAVIVMVFSIAGDAMEPPILAPEAEDPLPTEIVIASPTPKPSWTPSVTPSATPTPLPTATQTPTATRTATATLTPTITSTPTITNTPPASATFTLSPTSTLSPPTLTPTRTLTPTPSTTPLPTQAPTGVSAQPTSPYPFVVQPDSLILRENPADNGGCDWQGIGGQITEPTGAPVDGVQVRVTGPSIEQQTTFAGSAASYGPSGWEITLADGPTAAFYTVELYANDEQVSPSVEVVFPGSCQQNLATLNFVLNRPLD